MKIFLSAISDSEIDFFIRSGVKMKWNLLSFYQIYQMSEERGMAFFNKLLQHSEEILIDSGAHSFQFGKKVNWDEYTEAYCDFIRKVDCSKIIGYFEMDVDNIIGYDKVLALRRRIEQVTDKVIPVWHNTRGIADYKAMCEIFLSAYIMKAIVAVLDTPFLYWAKQIHDKGKDGWLFRRETSVAEAQS